MKKTMTFIAALVAAISLFTLSAAPTEATPTNTVLYRTVHNHCDMEFQYGNFGDATVYAHYRSALPDETSGGYTFDCWMYNARIFFVDANNNQHVSNNVTDYHNSITWNGITTSCFGDCVGWAAEWDWAIESSEVTGDDNCRQVYHFEATVFDGKSNGTLTTTYPPNGDCESL